jgi:hypothetical protein
LQDAEDQGGHQKNDRNEQPSHQRCVCLIGGVEGLWQASCREGMRTSAERRSDSKPLRAQQGVKPAAVDLLAQPARKRGRVGVGGRSHFDARI